MTQDSIPKLTLSQAVVSDVSFPWALDLTTVVTTSLIAIWLAQQLFTWFDYPILSLPELFWNVLVRLTPSSLVFWLHSLQVPTSSPAPTDKGPANASTSHAEKSRAMRELFRIGTSKQVLVGQRNTLATAPKGLGNWDNSCYQNSVLQALASLPSMQKFFANVTETLEGLPDSSTIDALHQLAQQLNDTTSTSTYHWTPAKLKSMSSWQQQDAQEYFSKLVDSMEKDISTEIKELSAKDEASALSLADFLDTSTTKNDSTVKREHAENDLAAVSKGANLARAVQVPFEGLLAQRVGCIECGYSEGLTLIPFNCLTVPIGRAPAYELRECLNEFTELEYIDGVECAKCSLVAAKLRLEQLSGNLSSPASVERPEDDTALLRQKLLVQDRLSAVNEAIENEDFSEKTLTEKCHIKKDLRKNSRKSRQAAVIRQPRCLVIHVNRSMFDEYTGSLLKNYADVAFPSSFDISPWCVGDQGATDSAWNMDPAQPLVFGEQPLQEARHGQYELKAVIAHYGRHENGHYVCFRQSPSTSNEKGGGDESLQDTDAALHAADVSDKWWRMSDEQVSSVDQAQMTGQGGAFMLFYEKKQHDVEPCEQSPEAGVAETTVHDPHSGRITNDAGESSVQAEMLSSPGETIPAPSGGD